MARRQRGGGTSAGGPLGNAARDLKDDFVGVPAETIKTGPPPRWPPKPKRVKSNTFHSKVTGNTSPGRADRAPHYRRGGWVSGYAKGGALEQVSKETSKGGLHRSLGVPEGQKIGAARIAKATHSSNPKIRREANLAETYAKYRKPMAARCQP